MATCFVIQPFDRGPFDKRYDDTVAPAIRDAGLEPYRVDRDPGVAIPIEDIEVGIKSAEACVADISTDNPNVWYELGFAIAACKPVILIAYAEPSRRFPFDIQHRHVIQYRTDSASDFVSLRSEIAARLTRAIERQGQLAELAQPSSVARIGGLTPHEIAALVVLGERTENDRHFISGATVRQEMENAGFTKIAVRIALQTLEGKTLISGQSFRDDEEGSQMFYTVTAQGAQWFLDHEEVLALRNATG